MMQQPEQSLAGPRRIIGSSRPRRVLRWIPLLILIGGILFPFEWLGEHWRRFGWGLNQVFSSNQRHAYGHAGLFFILGLVVLSMWPGLCVQPGRYLGLMIVALGQEGFQLIWKQRSLAFDDGRDLLTDVVGLITALVVVRLWYRYRAGTTRRRT